MTREENEQRIASLKAIALSLPESPGSYQFLDKEGIIIYVGKAKNLKSRVTTYFHTEVDRYKTKVLVSKVWNIKYTVTNSEESALLLENSLIKQYNPRYNVLLKDGKTYPSICVTKEQLPRIFKTRTINKRIGKYFGPYSQVSTMYAILEIINKTYCPRRCHMPITTDGIAKGKYKPCLEYHIKNCKGPCIGKQSIDEYQENIKQAIEILEGKTRKICSQIYDLMIQKASEMKFEEAEELKQKYIMLENFVAKTEVVSHTINDVDVFSIVEDDANHHAYINYIHVTNGTITQSFTYEYTRKLEETNTELLLSAIPEIRGRFGSKAKEIIVPYEIDWKMPDGATLIVPQRGDKKHLLELSELNGRQYKVDRLKQSDKLNPEQKMTRLMKELQSKLGMEKMPYHIECFDNSNISGDAAVAGCVVFKGMKPAKQDYRKYTIKTVAGPDDYASMQEVVRRRYTRMISEGKPLPDLIVTDGGVGQMNVVRQVVSDELNLNITIAGLAKDNKHRTNELLCGFPPQVVALKTNSELFHFLTRLQDEVHRFAITFHREKRSKKTLQSILDGIKGIGPKSKNALLASLKSVKRIKEADLQTLADILGNSKAQLVYNYLHKEALEKE